MSGNSVDRDAGLADLLRAHGSRIGPISGSWTCPPPCAARSFNGNIHDGNLTSHREREEQRITHLTAAIIDSEWFSARLAEAWDEGHRLTRPHSDACEPTCPNPYRHALTPSDHDCSTCCVDCLWDEAKCCERAARHLPPTTDSEPTS